MKQHGPYAFLLYLNSLNKKDEDGNDKRYINIIKEYCISLILPYIEESESSDEKEVDEYFEKLILSAAEDPATLTLVKNTLDQAFAYAVYHCKTFSPETEGGGS